MVYLKIDFQVLQFSFFAKTEIKKTTKQVSIGKQFFSPWSIPWKRNEWKKGNSSVDFNCVIFFSIRSEKKLNILTNFIYSLCEFRYKYLFNFYSGNNSFSAKKIFFYFRIELIFFVLSNKKKIDKLFCSKIYFMGLKKEKNEFLSWKRKYI